MKKTLVIAMLLAATTASADLLVRPRPTVVPSVTEDIIEGDAAATLYEAINTRPVVSARLRTGAETYKVQRSRDGLNQVACIKFVGRGHVSYTCETQSSNDGNKLKKFVRAIRMG